MSTSILYDIVSHALKILVLNFSIEESILRTHQVLGCRSQRVSSLILHIFGVWVGIFLGSHLALWRASFASDTLHVLQVVLEGYHDAGEVISGLLPHGLPDHAVNPRAPSLVYREIRLALGSEGLLLHPIPDFLYHLLVG